MRRSLARRLTRPPLTGLARRLYFFTTTPASRGKTTSHRVAEQTEISTATVGLRDPTFASCDGRSTRPGAENPNESRPIQGSMFANVAVPPRAIGDCVDAHRHREGATGSDHVDHGVSGDDEFWELPAAILPIRKRCAQGSSPRMRASESGWIQGQLLSGNHRVVERRKCVNS